MGRRRSRSQSRERRNDCDTDRDKRRSDRHKQDRDTDRRKSRERKSERVRRRDDEKTRGNSRKLKSEVRDRSKEVKKNQGRSSASDNETRREKSQSSGSKDSAPEVGGTKRSVEESQNQTGNNAGHCENQGVPDWVRDLVEPQPQAVVPVALAPNAGHKFVVIPQQYVSKVVGFQGATINEIQQATGSYIQLNQETKDKGYTIATITATSSQGLERAEAMISERIQSGLATQSMYSKGYFGMGRGGRISMGLS